MKKIIIANWKMNPKTSRDALRLADKVGRGIKGIRGVEVVLAPPFIYLPIVSNFACPPKLWRRQALRISNLKLGAQDVFWEREEAYTGEISPLQLKALGVELVIVGHSERRALGETNEIVRKKLEAVLESGMRCVLCVGEKEKERDVAFPKIIRDELHESLKKVKKSLFRHLIVAYEPIWAISGHGGSRADTPKDVYEMNILIRRELYRMIGKRIASVVPVLYGGSVDDKNAARFVGESGVDGLLVGGASLNHRKFVKIVKDIAGIQ